MNTPGIVLDRDRIADFCRRHRIRRLALFGSVLRDDFGPESDVDVLVEFEPGATPGLAFFGMQDELADIVGRPVDLCTPGCLKPRVREHVLRSAQDFYVAA
jgi:predicted nucleotidyltransferase